MSTQDMTDLRLGNNEIGVEGARAIAKALKQHNVRGSPPSGLFTHSKSTLNTGSHHPEPL